MSTRPSIITISIGGAVGALLRYAIGNGIYSLTGNAFTWGTMAVNLIGSFLIGLLWQFFNNHPVTPPMRTLIFTGGLGAFTTFSTYSLETVLLLQNGQIKLGLVNAIVSAGLGIIAVLLGMMFIQHLVPAQR